MSLDEDVTAPEAAEEENPQEEVEGKSVEETMELAKEADVSEEIEGEEEAKQEPEDDADKKKKSAGDRIGEITKKYRTEQRKTIALQDAVKKLEKQVNGVTEERTQEKQKEVDDEIERLWSEHADAQAELDGMKASKIFRKIDALERKKTVQPKAVPKEDEIDKKVTERETSRAVEQFKKRNPWFNKDSESYSSKMRKYAIAAEQELTESGYDGSFSDLLLEVERDVNETFKSKRPSGLPSVAGVNPTKRITTNKVTNLTDEQKEVAYGVFSGIPKAEAEAKYNTILKKQGGTR